MLVSFCGTLTSELLVLVLLKSVLLMLKTLGAENDVIIGIDIRALITFFASVQSLSTREKCKCY